MNLKPWLALAALTVAGGVAPAYALCALCTAEVRLDPSLADCFLKRADSELKALQAGGKGFVIIDLRDCETRGSLPTGAPASGPPPLLDNRFVADAAGVQCLSTAIEAMDDTQMTPSHVFDLTKDCPAQ